VHSEEFGFYHSEVFCGAVTEILTNQDNNRDEESLYNNFGFCMSAYNACNTTSESWTSDVTWNANRSGQ
jgi:hypothetical protein